MVATLLETASAIAQEISPRCNITFHFLRKNGIAIAGFEFLPKQTNI